MRRILAGSWLVIDVMAVVVVGALAGLASEARAQIVSEFVPGLKAPMKLLALEDGAVLVAEAGPGVNVGRISVIDRDRRRATLIDGLPSGLAQGTEPSGPSGLLLTGRRLFVTIGGGNATVPGPAPGSEVVNPTPSSRLFNSVLLIEFLPESEVMPVGFVLDLAAQARMADGAGVYLSNERGERIRVSRLADIPDYVAEPRPDVPQNVRASNLFGLTGSDAHVDVVDASRNLVWGIDLNGTAPRVLATFAPVRNTAPMGPPVVDAVPAGLRGYGDSLLVSYLTGFPFGAGAASIVLVDRTNGTSRPIVSGLQTAVDVLPVPGRSGRFYVLEHSANLPAQEPGRLLLVDDAGGRLVLAEGLRRPSSLAIDPHSGDILVSEVFANRIVLVKVPR